MLGEAEKPSGNAETLADSSEGGGSLCAVEHPGKTLFQPHPSSVSSPKGKRMIFSPQEATLHSESSGQNICILPLGPRPPRGTSQ